MCQCLLRDADASVIVQSSKPNGGTPDPLLRGVPRQLPRAATVQSRREHGWTADLQVTSVGFIDVQTLIRVVCHDIHRPSESLELDVDLSLLGPQLGGGVGDPDC